MTGSVERRPSLEALLRPIAPTLAAEQTLSYTAGVRIVTAIANFEPAGELAYRLR